MPEPKAMPDLAASLLGPSPAPAVGGPEEASENEQGREDQLQAFADFQNQELPMSERMDALAFFVELVQAAGPVQFPDE